MKSISKTESGMNDLPAKCIQTRSTPHHVHTPKMISTQYQTRRRGWQSFLFTRMKCGHPAFVWYTQNDDVHAKKKRPHALVSLRGLEPRSSESFWLSRSSENWKSDILTTYTIENSGGFQLFSTYEIEGESDAHIAASRVMVVVGQRVMISQYCRADLPWHIFRLCVYVKRDVYTYIYIFTHRLRQFRTMCSSGNARVPCECSRHARNGQKCASNPNRESRTVASRSSAVWIPVAVDR